VSGAEALRDILRFLNAHDFRREGDSGRISDGYCSREDVDQFPLQIFEDAIVANYATLRLGSHFQSIISPDANALGYKAQIIASANVVQAYSILDVSRLALTASDRHEVIYLDRLTRTLNALNYLAYGLKGDLHLSVNPQHLLEVHANHGEAFEQILVKCGLKPDQIVLEIAEHAVPDKQHLKIAIDGWKKRRYRIAIDGFGAAQTHLLRVLNLKPDIIKFDSGLVAAAGKTLAGRQRFEAMLGEIIANGVEVIATNVVSYESYEAVQAYRFSALQGLWPDSYSIAESAQNTA